MQFQTGPGLCIAFNAEGSRRRLQLRSAVARDPSRGRPYRHLKKLPCHRLESVPWSRRLSAGSEKYLKTVTEPHHFSPLSQLSAKKNSEQHGARCSERRLFGTSLCYALLCAFRHFAQRAVWAALMRASALADSLRLRRLAMAGTFPPLTFAQRAR